MRIAGIIIKGNKILLMHRIKNGKEYHVFPGGSMEGNETEEGALKREIKEETNLRIENFTKLFEFEHLDNREAFYLIKEFNGTPKIIGPEKERNNKQNQYCLEWVELSEIGNLQNLYPPEVVKRLLQFLRTQKI